jgi:very-short-patch-repair endonuclease
MSTTRARELRHNPTDPERKLWAILHSFRQSGYHFRRQYPIGAYYADFACIHAKLIIEADGETHASQGNYDLRSRGFRVLRLWNDEIMGNHEGVYEVIAQALANVPPLTPTPAPSPSTGGGRPRKQRTGLKNLSARTGSQA